MVVLLRSMKNTSESKITTSAGIQAQSVAKHQMYPATCDQCGKACEVPFAPAPNKPIYCADCFAKRKLAANTQVAAKQHANNPNPVKNTNGPIDVKQQLNAINSKLDRLIQMLTTKESVPAKVDVAVAPVRKAAKKVVAKKKTTAKKK